MRIFSVCLVIFLMAFWLFLQPIFAQAKPLFPEATDGQINDALARTVPVRLLPGNPIYFLVTIKEEINRFFQSSSVKKAQFDFVLSSKRLKEAYNLLGKNDVDNASWSLSRYGKRLEIMNRQIEKAKSQNQDVVTLAGTVADGLKNEEVLLFAIVKRRQVDGGVYGNSLNNAADDFRAAALEINTIIPGLKDRFKTVTFLEESQESTPSEKQREDVSSPTPLPSSNPRRYIY